MYEVEKIKEDLKVMLSERRYNHCLRVADVAMELARIYDINEEKAYVAGLLHDIAKEFSEEENKYYLDRYNLDEYLLGEEYKRILHAYIGAKYVKEKYNLDDDIVRAIDVHTVAAPDMDILAKILFVADKIEPNKDYIGIEEERRLAYLNIDAALKLCLENNIKSLLSKGKRPHSSTVDTLNLLKKLDI